MHDTLDELFPVAGTRRCSATLVLGSVATPLVFLLAGHNLTLNSLFLAEEDSLGEVALKRGVGYVFFDGQRGNLKCFS